MKEQAEAETASLKAADVAASNKVNRLYSEIVYIVSKSLKAEDVAASDKVRREGEKGRCAKWCCVVL